MTKRMTDKCAFAWRVALLVAVVCLLGGQADAQTTAWWHFDEAAAGTSAAANTVENSCNPGTYCDVFSCEGAGTNGYSAYLPRYARPFPGLRVYDPVSGETYMNRSAMEFRTASRGSLKAYYGGVLRTSAPDGFMPGSKSQLTVECLVCTTGMVAETFAPIVSYLSGTAFMNERWAIYYQKHSGSNKLALRFKGAVKMESSAVDADITDGRWHHIALSWDGSNAKIYVDYELKRNYTDFSSGDIAVNYNPDIYIGGYTTQYNDNSGCRRFNGLIDEVRISNAVLEPAQFLRLLPTSGDADEVVRMRFDSAVGGPLRHGEVVTENFDFQGQHYEYSGSDPATYDMTTMPAKRIANTESAVALPDVSSYCQTTNEAGYASYVLVTNIVAAIGTGDRNYTIEAFFRARDSLRGKTLLKIQKANSTGTYGHIYFTDDGYVQFIRTERVYWGLAYSTYESSVSEDGCWHHIAVVNDRTNDKVLFYFDHRLVKTSDVKVSALGDPTLWHLYVGVGATQNVIEPAKFFNGWIDELRITKRALGPSEFLHGRTPGPMVIVE